MDRLKVGLRPESAACRRTRSMKRAVSFSGSPQSMIDIDMRGQRPDRRVGAAAAVDRNVRLLATADFRIGPSGPVELALVVERRPFGPGPAQQGDIFLGAAIAGVMFGPVAVLGLLGVAAAGNDVHRQSAIAELVQSRQLTGGDRRRHEPWAVRQ